MERREMKLVQQNCFVFRGSSSSRAAASAAKMTPALADKDRQGYHWVISSLPVDIAARLWPSVSLASKGKLGKQA